MSKTLILPIVGVIAFIIQAVFGITIQAELQDQIALIITNAIATGFVVYGVVKDHKLKKLKLSKHIK